MPVIDMTKIRCQWCHTDRGVFACHVCNKPTCRECVKVATEGTCEHEKYQAPAQQGWTGSDFINDGFE